MVIEPKIKGFVCTTAHPLGCEAHVKEQIDYVKSKAPIPQGAKKVLVVGASTGYGLASRITAAFACGADTLGVFFEKEAAGKRTASAGWYNSAAFEKFAKAEGLYARSINGDAFSDEIKDITIKALKEDFAKVDLVVYSLASPRRQHPKTGEVAKSVLKPIGKNITDKTLDTDRSVIKEVSLEAATQEEIDDTVRVMGGEDWEMWLDALSAADVLADGCKTVAYTYIGDKITWPIYGEATIGRAKEDLDRAARAITEKLQAKSVTANVCVLKALVTQSSSAIPIMPLYISLLYKVMKEKGGHEGCIEQIHGLFADRIYATGNVETDDKNRFRMDGLELRPEIQREVEAAWGQITTENLYELTDFKGYKEEFLKLFGFGLSGVAYDADLDPEVRIDLIN
ncbi:MAG TPA: enoyl-ACP reductase FabV [Pseudomonadales bacterium]